MSYGRSSGALNFQQIAPTCYIQSTITGECASRPVGMEPMMRGLVPTYNGGCIMPGGICGLNTSNAHIPCCGGGYCSDVYYGTCQQTNALLNPKVNLPYVAYGTRLG